MSYEGISRSIIEVLGLMNDSPRYDPEGRLLDAVRSAERATVQLRNLTSRALRNETKSLDSAIVEALDIKVEKAYSWYKITVPAILPKRHSNEGASYITRPLRSALVQFQRKNLVERFEHCTICIVHCYDEALGLRRVRDYDNIETKRYLDVIESVMLINDSGLLCDVYQTTRTADRDCTEFYLMAPEKFQTWLIRHGK